jgi:uncharacterized secreted protein with C-terminal beta-propeller domain
MQIFKKLISEKIGIIIVLTVFLIAISFIVLNNKNLKNKSWFFDFNFPSKKISSEIEKIKKFSSEKEFKNYLQAGINEITGYYSGRIKRMDIMETAMPTATIDEAQIESKKEITVSERISETNVQVLGIDEPDIVKTNGKEIYFSSEFFYPLTEKFVEESISPLAINKTKIINAFPPIDLLTISNIDKTGTLLLDKNILVIFSNQEIFSYDVSDPKSPKEKWNIKLENNVSIADSRLYKNKIYLVTKTWINQYQPCQIKLLTTNETPLEIKCIDIYHPVSQVPVDTTFIAMILDPITGKIEKNISFVGSSNSSVIYMSENGIYITYSYSEGIIKLFSGFIKENQDIYPNWINEKMEKLENYDIGSQAKLTEFQSILENYQNSLNNDERMKMESELSNRMSKYYKTHQRELEKTGIVKIELEKFDIKATGNVPGYPLNQFALDEYQNNLRIATTIGERGIGFMFNRGNQETANDIYVLDKDLKIQGSIENLGLTEKIYSARFIEDRGYLVTFRQTDPFYVLDLKNPKKPELKGELKIPGYSSYLHPISNDIILGIGKEVQHIKLSLFDVASPKNPKEIDKYLLDEYWSDALDNHHAFLLDKKHNVFFLPGGKGGYIFSYENNKFKLVKAISQISAKRALFINDYLYIIGDDKITILNEIDWEKVNELKL